MDDKAMGSLIRPSSGAVAAGPAPLPPRFAGPWARSAQEVRDCWGVLGGLIGHLAAGLVTDPGRTASELSYGERYALGAHAAARWTLGITTRAPLTGQDTVADAHRVTIELAFADRCLAGDGPLRDPAAGVRAWLAWLIGRAERLVLHSL